MRGVLQLVPAELQIYLPPRILLRSVSANEPLQEPWPRLIVSIGRRSVPVALALKKLSGAFAVHIQHPKVPARLFDLIAAPVHDDFEAPNVIVTLGAVHSVRAEKLDEAAGRGAGVDIHWYYDEEDDTMKELGQEFGEDLEHATFHLEVMRR